MLNHLGFFFFFFAFFFLRLGLGQRRAVVIIGRWLLPSLVDTGDICCHYWQHILVDVGSMLIMVCYFKKIFGINQAEDRVMRPDLLHQHISALASLREWSVVSAWLRIWAQPRNPCQSHNSASASTWKCRISVWISGTKIIPSNQKISVFTRGQFWPPGIVVACVCVCVCIIHLLVRTITRHLFKLGSPNLVQRSKTPWLRSLLFWGAIDLYLQGQI